LIRKILNLRLFDADAETLPAETSILQGSAPSSSTMPSVSLETGVAEGSVSTPVKERSRAWKRSVMDIDGEVLCGKFPALVSCSDSRAKLTFTLLAGISSETVSQFTLMARTEKGSKPGQSPI
jgi:D-Tyr-tRNAtyr deacylase